MLYQVSHFLVIKKEMKYLNQQGAIKARLEKVSVELKGQVWLSKELGRKAEEQGLAGGNRE